MYFEVSASCLAFLFQRLARLLDLLVLALDLLVLVREQAGLFLQLLVGLLQFLLPALQLLRERLRLREQVLGAHVGFDRVDHDADRFGQLVEERLVRGAEALEGGELEHALDLAFEHDRQHQDVRGEAFAQAGADLDVVARARWRAGSSAFRARTGRRGPSPSSSRLPWLSWPSGGVAGEQRQLVGLAAAVEHVEHRLLRADHRRQFRQDQAADGEQVALALQHAAELGEVGLQPVLLGVLLRRVLQVADHLVDGVLEGRHLALRLDRDRARQVALGHRGGDLGDGAHLRGQVGGELVDVLGQVLPGAGGARHLGLAAELAFDAHLARHRGHLVGEGGERVGHAVDGVGERGDFALGFDRELLLQVAVGHRGHDLGDAAHLARSGCRP